MNPKVLEIVRNARKAADVHYYHFDRECSFTQVKTACGIWADWDNTDLKNPTCWECMEAKKQNDKDDDDIPF